MKTNAVINLGACVIACLALGLFAASRASAAPGVQNVPPIVFPGALSQIQNPGMNVGAGCPSLQFRSGNKVTCTGFAG